MQDDKTNDKADQKAPIKKRSILDNPKQRRLFEKMGMTIRVSKPDDKK